MCDDLNVLYLCGMYSEKQCHSNYDNWSVEKVKEMNIFLKVEKVFKDLKIILTETLNYKHYDRWQI
jgi:hypothetical protein